MLTKQQRDEMRAIVIGRLDDDGLYAVQERSERADLGTSFPRHVAEMIEEIRIARERLPMLLDAIDEMDAFLLQNKRALR